MARSPTRSTPGTVGRPTQDRREPFAPIGTIRSGPGLLAGAGANADETARAAGINPARFSDPTALISFAEMARYLAAGVWAAKDDRFALRLGLAEGPSVLNAIGYLVQHSPDVRTSLETLRTYIHHFSGAISLSRQGELAVLEYTFLYPQIEGAGLITEAGMGLSLAILRQLCGPAWNPVELRLSRSLPPRPAAWRRCVQAPIVFGADRDCVTFSARWLEQPVEHADQELRRILHDRVVELEAREGAELPLRVCSVIRAMLLTGNVAQADVASRLAMGPRTLARRLGAHDTTFDALLDKTRLELACHLLDNSAASMSRITDLLGYAHSSALRVRFAVGQACRRDAARAAAPAAECTVRSSRSAMTRCHYSTGFAFPAHMPPCPRFGPSV